MKWCLLGAPYGCRLGPDKFDRYDVSGQDSTRCNLATVAISDWLVAILTQPGKIVELVYTESNWLMQLRAKCRHVPPMRKLYTQVLGFYGLFVIKSGHQLKGTRVSIGIGYFIWITGFGSLLISFVNLFKSNTRNIRFNLNFLSINSRIRFSLIYTINWYDNTYL